MPTKNFIKLCAAVHELSRCQRNRETDIKLSDDAENNTMVATADSNNIQTSAPCSNSNWR